MNTNFQLPPILFWDIDPARLDYDAKARYVIGRVVMYGTLADWKATLEYYGPARADMSIPGILLPSGIGFTS